MGPLLRRAPLLLILCTAAFLRLYGLSDLPPAHYRDVALTATDALRAAQGHPRLHFTYDEGLYADLMGLGFAILGATDWSVRLPGALFGILTCWGVFRMGRALGRERAGTYGAALLAVSFWHVLLSRSGFRAVLLPCLLAHSTALLVEGLRQGRGTWRVLLAGALLGLGVHVYPAVRFAPLFLAAWLIGEMVTGRGDRDDRHRVLRTSALFAAAALAVSAPMLAHYLHHPEHFTYPRRILSVFSAQVPARDIPGHVAHNLIATLLMFHVRGDLNNRHNLSGAPMLDPLSGLLLLIGLLRLWRRGPRSDATLLLGWLAAMLLPNLLSVEGVPHGLRSCGVLPVVALLSGIGLDVLRDSLGRRLGWRTAITAPLVIVVAVGCWTGYRYFEVWGKNPQVIRDHDGAYRQAARRLLAAPADTALLLVANGSGLPANGHPVEAETYLFEMRDRPPAVLGPKDASRLVLSGRKALVAFIARDDRIVGILRDLNPGASVVEVQETGLPPQSPIYRVN